jgi:hypothetical protein
MEIVEAIGDVGVVVGLTILVFAPRVVAIVLAGRW